MGTSEQGELAQAQGAFARHFVSQAEEAVRQLWGPEYRGAEAFIRHERGNCMEAIRVLFDSDKATGLRLLVAVGELASDVNVPSGQGRDWLEWAERYHGACADMPPSSLRARLAYGLGWSRYMAESSSAMPAETIGSCWEESVHLAEACGDLETLGKAQVCRGMSGDDLPAGARAALARDGIANARASGSEQVLAFALQIVATGTWCGKDLASRKKDMEAALAIAERIGRQPMLASYVNAMGRVYRAEDMHAEAIPWFARADEMIRNLKLPPLWFAFDLPLSYLFLRQPGKARPLVGETFTAAIGLGDPKLLASGLACFVLLAFAESRNERGAKLYAAWMAQDSPGRDPPPEHLTFLGEAATGAIREFWSVGQAMSLDEAVAFAKEDW
jgi:hypothetical protein